MYIQIGGFMGTKVLETEKVFKGLANHHRLNMLEIIQKNGPINLFDLAQRSGVNYRTASEHSRRLRIAGLVSTKYQGQDVMHVLTPLGKRAQEYIPKILKP
jgi:DNA-binding transcriptional ArsR family regulator